MLANKFCVGLSNIYLLLLITVKCTPVLSGFSSYAAYGVVTIVDASVSTKTG